MAHNMEVIDGLTSFSRADCEPDSWWSNHPGLSQQVYAKGTNWQEIAGLANLNHDVTLHEMVTLGADGMPLWDEDGSKMFRPIRTWQGGKRDGSIQSFGRPFSERYGLVQVKDMADFAKAIEAIMPGAYIATAGAVRNGNRAFISVRLGTTTVQINGFEDKTNLYLSILNSWDGSSAFAVANGSYRTECDNTFSGNLAKLKVATKGGRFTSGQAVYLKHTGAMADKLENAKVAVAEELGWSDAYTKYAQALADTPMTTAQFDKMVKRLVATIGPDPSPQQLAQVDRKVAGLKAEWNTEAKSRGGKTAWGALNAFTALASHMSISKGTKLSPGIELEARVFGDTVPAKQGVALVDQVTAYLAEQLLVTV